MPPVVPPLRRRTIVHIEYNSVCPYVGIGSPHSFPRKRVCLSPLDPKGILALLVRGWGVPIWTTGKKAWHSVFSVPHYLEGITS